MSLYSGIISRATGRTDQGELAKIEDTMRHVIFHSTLDWQTAAELTCGAIEAEAVLVAMGKIPAGVRS